MASRQKLIVDTCVFMENINILEELVQEYDVCIPYVVLQELDHHKDRGDSWRSFKGRTAIKFINANYNKFNFIETENGSDIGNDDLIIKTAKQNNCAVATYDICMKVKCKALDIPLVELNNDKKEYKGYKIVEMSDEEMADFYKNMKNKWDILTNEYLLIQNKNKEIVDKYKWNGKEFQVVRYKTINNKFMGKIKPLNIQQELLFDMLQDNESKIKQIGRAHV